MSEQIHIRTIITENNLKEIITAMSRAGLRKDKQRCFAMLVSGLCVIVCAACFHAGLTIAGIINLLCVFALFLYLFFYRKRIITANVKRYDRFISACGGSFGLQVTFFPDHMHILNEVSGKEKDVRYSHVIRHRIRTDHYVIFSFLDEKNGLLQFLPFAREDMAKYRLQRFLL